MLLIFLIDQHFSVKKGQLKRFDINNNNKQFIKLLLGELERTLFNVSLAGCLLVNGNKKTKNSDKGENNRVHGIRIGNLLFSNRICGPISARFLSPNGFNGREWQSLLVPEPLHRSFCAERDFCQHGSVQPHFQKRAHPLCRPGACRQGRN